MVVQLDAIEPAAVGGVHAVPLGHEVLERSPLGLGEAPAAPVAPHDPAVQRQPEYAELQGMIGTLYGLSETDFRHILSTFPLIPEEVKSSVLLQFNNFHSIT